MGLLSREQQHWIIIPPSGYNTRTATLNCFIPYFVDKTLEYFLIPNPDQYQEWDMID